MTSPEFEAFTWDALTRDDLYDALQLRAQVFVVEQDCAYQDLDGRDREAIHILGRDGDARVVAYCRWMEDEDAVRLGRIVVAADARNRGLGRRLMEEALRRIGPDVRIVMHAQAHLDGFYGRFGFEVTSAPFLEDGIPHVAMERRQSSSEARKA